MLEKYRKNFDDEEFISSLMKKRNIRTKSMVLAILRKEIPKESYFQDQIKKTLKKRYPEAFIRKIAQGAYSEGGTPDIMMIYMGHYFGFEVKRPVVGELSALQKRTIEQIRRAGGTAEVVRWPEEAIEAVEKWKEGWIHGCNDQRS